MPLDKPKLRYAAQLLREATAGVVPTGKPCNSCGLHKLDNFKEFNIARSVQTMAAKLEHIAEEHR